MQALFAIMELIAKSGLTIGDRLPPERKLLSQLDCSLITLRRALTELMNSGIIERHQGQGTFLRQQVSSSRFQGNILYININVHGEYTAPEGAVQEHLSEYFNPRGLQVEYLSVHDFSDTIVSAARKAQGIIVYGAFTAAFLKRLAALHLPFILVGGKDFSNRYAQVTVDASRYAEQLVDFLIQGGARHLALLNSAPGYFMTQEIEEGFQRGIANAAIPVEHTSTMVKSCCRHIDRLLPDLYRYDAILMEFGVYMEFLAACRQHNMVVPCRIGVLPLSSITIYNRLLLRPDRNTLFAYIPESAFYAAAEILYNHISSGVPMTSRKLPCVIAQDESALKR